MKKYVVSLYDEDQGHLVYRCEVLEESSLIEDLASRICREKSDEHGRSYMVRYEERRPTTKALSAGNRYRTVSRKYRR